MWVRARIERGIDPHADPSGMTKHRLQPADRLGVDEGTAVEGGRQVGIGLAGAVDHDPIRRRPRPQCQRQLDGTDDLEADALGRQPPQQRRIGVRLDRERYQCARQCAPPGSCALGRRVEIGDVQRRAPALGRIGEKGGVHRPILRP